LDTVCDKCGTEVPPINDAVNFDLILTGDPLLIFATSRHLLPVVEEGVVVCAGSPSRAQYLEGQLRDSRGLFDYDSSLESRFRQVYAKLLETISA
jgi:hypothetical protein